MKSKKSHLLVLTGIMTLVWPLLIGAAETDKTTEVKKSGWVKHVTSSADTSDAPAATTPAPKSAVPSNTSRPSQPVPPAPTKPSPPPVSRTGGWISKQVTDSTQQQEASSNVVAADNEEVATKPASPEELEGVDPEEDEEEELLEKEVQETNNTIMSDEEYEDRIARAEADGTNTSDETSGAVSKVADLITEGEEEEEVVNDIPDTLPEKPETTLPLTEVAVTVGDPVSEDKLNDLVNEMVEGWKKRNRTTQFQTFRSYAASRMAATTARQTGIELAGNCRLDWFTYLLSNPLSAVGEADRFTKDLHSKLNNTETGLMETIAVSRKKLDMPARSEQRAEVLAKRISDTPGGTLEILRRTLDSAQMNYVRAMRNLSTENIDYLLKYAASSLVTSNRVGHALRSRSSGRKSLDLLELRLDRVAMIEAGEDIANLADTRFVKKLASLPFTDTVQRINGRSGDILLGTTGDDTYQLDTMAGVAMVIDPGGNDTYLEGSVSPMRPIMVIFDLAGDDVYRGSQSGIQGGAVLGISMLVDVEGDDQYLAKDIAQGSTVGGCGFLIDLDGTDRYEGIRHLQGAAIAGLGFISDLGGDDKYKAGMMAQGLGRPLGVGIINDKDGADHYFCGGMFINSYINDEDSPTPGYEGWGQGIGCGIRAVACGGFGVLLDGGGDDIYEAGYFSHGGGYWCGVGFARDFDGNDQRLGATRVAYNGGSRSQRRFVRFNNGFGCHYALGFSLDDRGDDTYYGSIMCLGFAWDCAVGYLLDFDGNDYYRGSMGQGAQASLGSLYDFNGTDTYSGSRPGYAKSSISYHPMPRCGGNFSFVIDHGGKDKYSSRYLKNDGYYKRGMTTGFLIDRASAAPEPEGVEEE